LRKTTLISARALLALINDIRVCKCERVAQEIDEHLTNTIGVAIEPPRRCPTRAQSLLRRNALNNRFRSGDERLDLTPICIKAHQAPIQTLGRVRGGGDA